ncbi:MAG: hypothetical protein CMJ18_12660 [Phycisphaeraceae bacterium]|nr:hypothetical protein [Phycisphaeraceae bacterium]
MFKTNVLIAVTAVLVTIMAVPTMAILHRDEPFDYPGGEDLHNQGTWSGVNINHVASGSLMYPGLLSSGNRSRS